MASKQHLYGLWDEAVKKAVGTYEGPVGPERHKALLAMWHHVLHRLIIVSEGCGCQNGRLDKCVFFQNTERSAEAMKGQEFSFENFEQAIGAEIKNRREYKSPAERETEDGRQKVADIKLSKLREAAAVYLSYKSADERRRAVVLVWREFVHQSALAMGQCGCQLGEPNECWGNMDVEVIKKKAEGRGRGWETFFSEVEKAAKDLEVEILRANPNLLGKA